MADGMEKQLEGLRSQLDDMRSRMDYMTGMMEEYRTRGGEMMAEARGRAREVGRKVGEQKGIAVPFGLLLTLGLSAMAVWIFFPDLGERLKSMMVMGPTEKEKR